MTKGPEISIESVKAVVRQLVEQLWPHEINAFEMSLGQLTHWPYHWQYIEPAKWKVEDLLAEATASSGYAFPGILPEETRPWLYFVLVIDAVADHLQSLEKVPEVIEMEAAYEKFGSHRELPNDVLAAGKPLVIKWLQSHFRKQLPPIPISTKKESQQIEVEFTSTGVSLNKGKEKPFIDEWRMLEYFLWKNDRVYWTEGYLIFPRWRSLPYGATNGRKQFREKATKCKQAVEKCGLKIEFTKTKHEKTVWWKLVTYNISTNITKAESHYKEAKELFDNDKWGDARHELLEALEAYPNHLQSHLLLLRCYEKQGPKKLSTTQLRELQSSWYYLDGKCAALNDIRRICSKKKDDKELQVFLSSLLNGPLYSQLEGLTDVLFGWIMKGELTEDEILIMEVNKLLREIRTAKDDAVRDKKKEAFCRIPCVAEILASDTKSAEVSGLLFFSSAEDDLVAPRFQAIVRRTYKSKEELQKTLRNNLVYLRTDLKRQERLRQLGGSKKIANDVERLDELKEELRQKLHKERIADEELIKSAEAEYRWDREYVKRLLKLKATKHYRELREDDSIKRTF